MILRWRRRITDLEARVTALEATTPVDYTMPPPVHIDMTPRPPIAELPEYNGPSLDQDEDWPSTGVYI